MRNREDFSISFNEWGSDDFKLIFKSSTKEVSAMEIENVGCVLQVIGKNESITFIPKVRIKEFIKDDKVYKRTLISFNKK